MSKDKKNVKLEENKQEKKSIINKKLVFIIVGIVLILIVVISIIIFLNKEDKPSNLPKENEIVEEDNTPVFEEKTFEEQKNILLDILNQEITKYEEICTDSDNSECITEETKTDILNTFNSFKERLEIEEITLEEIEQIKQELNDYLVTLDPEVKLDDLISEETKSEESNADLEKEENKGSSSSSGASGIEGILNSAKLNPVKTGYTALDNQVASVINSVTNNSMSTYEKVKVLYDWVINNMSYQIGFVIGEEIASLINNYGFYEMDATQIFLAENGFGTKKGSCDNYSAMFMILTRRIGLDSYVVSARNKNGTGHTTVNIKINGKWYNFDPQREDNSLKNGKIMYYAFGEDDSDSKPYTYIDRNSDVAAFHAFAKQPDENYFKASITIAGKTYSAKTAVSSYSYVSQDIIEIDYVSNPNTPIKIDVNGTADYIVTTSSNTTTNYVWSTVNGDRGTINSSGEVTITQKWGSSYYLIVHLEDNNDRELNFVVKLNFRDASKTFTIDAGVSSYEEIDHFSFNARGFDAVGNVTFVAKVIDTNDPKGVAAITVTPGWNNGDFQIGNTDWTKYWYKVEVTGTDSAGNVATTIFESKILDKTW